MVQAETKKQLASRIRLARRAMGESQAEVAQRLGVSRSALAQWESPEGSRPRALNLAALALCLGCSFEWLATGRGSRTAGLSNADQGASAAVVLTYFAHSNEEEDLLTLFRSLDDWGQRALLSIGQTLSARPPARKSRRRA